MDMISFGLFNGRRHVHCTKFESNIDKGVKITDTTPCTLCKGFLLGFSPIQLTKSPSVLKNSYVVFFSLWESDSR